MATVPRSLHDIYHSRDLPAFQKLLKPPKGSHKVASAIVNRLDLRGKAVLHHAVSSVEPARWDFVVALLGCATVNVNLQDKESGWTPLHRALYSGNLEAARALIAHPNIDLRIKDNEGLTAFDLYNASVDGVNPQPGEAAAELYAWGSNRNFTLGFKGDSDRNLPERVALVKVVSADEVGKHGSFGGVGVRDVAMSKFQTAVVTDERSGNVRFCGSTSDARVGKNANTRFSFERLPGFSSVIVHIAAATDHTLLLDDRGDVFTFGLNHHGQLGYPLEGEEIAQLAPKRVVGLRKEHVIGVAASRVHSVAFTADSLYTWGASRGQLGYATPGSAIQAVPRKVSTLPSPVTAAIATEYATVCLLESHDVLVFQKNAYFKMFFNVQRFPQNKQVYRPPQLSYESKPIITKIAGCGSHLVALSQMGDVFSWTLDDADTQASVVARSPVRVWDRRKQFTGVTDVAVGNDTLIMATVSGHVFVRQKRMDVIKGADLRGANAATTSSKKLHKVTRMPFLQRVVRVAANDAGGFAALRADAPIKVPPINGRSLADDFSGLLPHLSLAPKAIDVLRDGDEAAPTSVEDMEDHNPIIEREFQIVSDYWHAAMEWHDNWSRPRGGADVLLIAEGGKEIPAHAVILAARSPVLRRILDGKPSDAGDTIIREKAPRNDGFPRIALRRHNLLTVLLLLHYLYTDSPLALWDPRLAARLPTMGIAGLRGIAALRDDLQRLANLLQLPALARVLALPERASPEPTLSLHLSSLLHVAPSKQSSLRPDVVLELADGERLYAHRAVLRARCPFFSAMLEDDVWTAERYASAMDDTISIDLRTQDKDIMEIVLRHLYTDEGLNLLREIVRPNADAYIDFVFRIIAAANELLLDSLKAVCSTVLCRFVNLQNVGAILGDADFYHSDELVESCMLYLSRNMETALECRYLDDFPVALLRRLAAFCRSRQLQKLPISRSEDWINDLLAKHVDFYSDLDLAKPAAGKRKWRFLQRSPRLSPADASLSTSLPNGSLAFSAGGRLSSGPSPLLEAVREPIESPPASPSPSPGTPLPDESTFVMDEFEPAAPSSTTMLPKTPWATALPTSDIPPLDLRNIMATESQAQQPTQRPRLSASHESTPIRLSQRERRRHPDLTSPPASPSPMSTPWRPATTPTWRVAEAAKASSLASIQSEQASGTPQRQVVSPQHGRPPLTPTPPGRRPPLQSSGSSGSTPLKTDPASGIGVPVITPLRSTSGAKVRPSRGGNTDAWVNYASASSSFRTSPMLDSSSPQNASFANIQSQQQDEGSAIRNAKKMPASLAEIQREEAFKSWWDEESAKAQAATPLAHESGHSTTRGSRRRGRGGIKPAAPPRGRGN